MSEFHSVLQLSSLNGRNGFQISGEEGNFHSGTTVASAGDVNGDGFDDFIIGADYSKYCYVDVCDRASQSYVVFGRASDFPSTIQLSNLNGRNGFQLTGETSLYEGSNVAVASAGDINGDGFDDLIMGDSQGYTDEVGTVGFSYVVFGKASGFDSNLQLSSLNGVNGFRISGEANDDRSGASVASAGDVNGDGFDDVIIGAPGANPNSFGSGASYVVFGKARNFVSNLQLSNLNGTNGFQISGEKHFDYSGSSVASAGDVNGDGFADLAIGSPGPPHAASNGSAYVVFGKAKGFASAINLSTLNGANGFKLVGHAGDTFGSTIAGAGDVNGDGFGGEVLRRLERVAGDLHERVGRRARVQRPHRAVVALRHRVAHRNHLGTPDLADDHPVR